METIKIREFSRLVNVTEGAIRKAMKKGRIAPTSITKDAKGGPVLLKDPALNDWAQTGGTVPAVKSNEDEQDRIALQKVIAKINGLSDRIKNIKTADDVYHLICMYGIGLKELTLLMPIQEDIKATPEQAAKIIANYYLTAEQALLEGFQY